MGLVVHMNLALRKALSPILKSGGGVCRTLIALLGGGDHLLQFLMELIKVDHKVACTSADEVVFWMDGDIGMVAFIGEEGQDACSSTRSVVVGKLGQRQELGPVVLLVIAVGLYVLFQGLIYLLSLSVALRMVTGHEV